MFSVVHFTCLLFPQLAGGVILGVALWLRHDPQTTSLLYLELGDRPAPNTFYVGECVAWADNLASPSRYLTKNSEVADRQSGRASRRRQGPSGLAVHWGGEETSRKSSLCMRVSLWG